MPRTKKGRSAWPDVYRFWEQKSKVMKASTPLPPYVPYYLYYNKKKAERLSKGPVTFPVTREDKVIFPELRGRKTVVLQRRSNGLLLEVEEEDHSQAVEVPQRPLTLL